MYELGFFGYESEIDPALLGRVPGRIAARARNRMRARVSVVALARRSTDPARMPHRAGSDNAADVVSRITVIRGERVLLDSDLAALYGATTKRLNEQVRRNAGRFPEDFA